ncbi:hypothetical protein [Pseudomonas aeruginosa]|uniref:hypothetical protein n=1 Tax=Pseudomonas aeruginosa TaxID=287 RepID=UPI00163C3A8D|nr:hypothetical protein [Pseudomonas aeruginosa]
MQQNENFAKQAEQAEAERPEVVAYFDRNYPSTGDAFIWSNYEGSPYEPVMTVAQHERIVVAEKGKTAAAMLESHRQFVRQFEEGTAELIAQRDAALARVAELAQALRHLLHNIKASGKRIDLGLAKECAEDALARIDSTVAAQAQHSVPEGYALIPTRETEAMHDAVMALLYKGVARTDTQKLLDAYIAAAPGKEVPQAWHDVQAERRRQIETEGWTPEHDDEHNGGELADAAACYALWAGGINPGNWREFWPWAPEWLKHSEPRRMLVKAAALILAEIQRLDRAAAPGKEGA